MISASEALERLREGNRRFVADDCNGGQQAGKNRRRELAEGQEPFATILGCSDSRVPAEIIFDQGLGDLFVIRVAGNIIAPDPDAERWQRHIIDAIHSAEEFGCATILTHTGSMYPNRNIAHPQNWSKEAWERSVNALKRICKDTAGSKVDIAIEPVNTESINNPWAMRRLRDDVGDDRICWRDLTESDALQCAGHLRAELRVPRRRATRNDGHDGRKEAQHRRHKRPIVWVR